jgi:AbrB family looped-hinge helix DNA binding protein
MTTTIGPRGQIVIPKAIRAGRHIEPGDDFEVIADDDDFDLILLRRLRRNANAGLIDHLAACPDRGALRLPSRKPERMRRPRL